MKEFVHLHVHTEYSLLDGLARIDKLVDTTKARGGTAVAITDHGNMYGTIKFYEKCILSGIKPIIGSEVYVTYDMHSRSNKADTAHLILLAKNNEGYENLMKLSSKAFLDGMYYKPRIDYKLLAQHSKGLICLSACIAGHIPQYILHGEMDEAEKLALWFKDLFGEDFYFEIQNHNITGQQEVLLGLTHLSKKLGIKMVATNDVHYIDKSDAMLQDILMCVQMGKTYEDYDRFKFETQELYLKTYDEMLAALPGYEEALDRTREIADKCDVVIKTKSLREAGAPERYWLGANQNYIPQYVTSTGETPFEFLSRISWEGLEHNYREVTQTLKDRLNMELDTINRLGFVEYFLIVWDYINFARENDIPVGPGRGSGAGSLVAYCSGITRVDPMRYELYFDRFINPERVSMPDFDVDFDTDRRGEVVEYAKRRYGEDHVANIVTYGCMQAKNAIRDVARVLRVPYSEADRINKEIPLKPLHKPPVLSLYFGLTGKVEDEKYKVPELVKMYNENSTVRQIINIAKELEGVPRNTSMHAAGVLIAPKPIDNFVPMAKNGDEIVTQFDMTELEHLGLLKMDFLGLITATDIDKACKYVKQNYGVDIDFIHMEYNDQKVFDLICSGNTTAVFQLEQGGMTSFMKELQPSSLEDIIAGIALYRPGPMDFIPKFIKGKKNPQHIEYEDPCLEPILCNTYGCIVYQEQVMKIFQVMGGYTLGGADVVRRIMGKKKAEQMVIEKQKFIHGYKDPTGKNKDIPGAVALGHDEKVSEKVFDQMAKFAGYAFNKAHAAAYAVICYQTAYLKTYYEPEFLTAVLNNRITKADQITKYTNHARAENIQILPPDINHSDSFFKTENGNIRFGLGGLKHVGSSITDIIVEERNKNGEFKSFEDFARRTCGIGINKRLCESLIVSGVFDCFGIPRSQLMEVHELVFERALADYKKRVTGQFSIFDTFAEETQTINHIDYPDIKEYSKEVMLKYEKEVVGIYLSGHPLDAYRDKYEAFNFSSDMMPSDEFENEEEEESDDIDEERPEMIMMDTQVTDGQSVIGGGIITEVKRIINKNMAIITVEDLNGTFDCMVFNKVLSKYKDVVKEEEKVTITGKISIRPGKSPIVVAEKIVSWNKPQTPASKPGKKLYLRFNTKDTEIFERVKKIIATYPGTIPVICRCTATGNAFVFSSEAELNNYLKNELVGLLGEENVVIK